LKELLVLDHVHWDREWYRPHEEFRARLLELVEEVVSQLERGERPAFHLDGQTITITIADVLEIRPELESRLSALVRAGRLTVGPWHVLADNQLVSGECLVRNLLIGRRWGRRLGGLAQDGYSPDAFGHPADLPRILLGFGLLTALVWRGAPPEHPRFRWRSPDGSEVFVVNQRYHEAEVLWEEETAAERLRAFAAHEAERCPEGPWLLMNGGDHLMPRLPQDRADAAQRAGLIAVPVSLPAFFDAARRAVEHRPVPLIEGDLRHIGDRLTFLLPGTLSTRTYPKQANVRGQTMLTDWAEPLGVLSPSPEGPGCCGMPGSWWCRTPPTTRSAGAARTTYTSRTSSAPHASNSSPNISAREPFIGSACGHNAPAQLRPVPPRSQCSTRMPARHPGR